MEFLKKNYEYQIVAEALAHEGKMHCGDYLRLASIDSEQLVVLALSDGVGSLHHNWVTSQTACYRFIDSFIQSADSKLQTRFENGGKEADNTVPGSFNSVPKGMECLFTAVVWNIKLNGILFHNIVDNRLSHHRYN